MASADSKALRPSTRRAALAERLARVELPDGWTLGAALAIIGALLAIGAATGGVGTLVATFVLVPLFAAVVGSTRITAVAALVAVAAAIASGASAGAWEESDFLIRVGALVVGSAFAIFAAWLRTRSRGTIRRLAVLAAIGEIADETRPVDETLEAFSRRLVPELADLCIVDAIIDGEVERVAVAAAGPRAEWIEGVVAARLPPGASAPTGSARAINSRRAQLVRNVDEELLRGIAHGDEDLRTLVEIAPRSVAVVPLVARDRVLGALKLVTADSGRVFDDDDFVFMQVVGGRAALALDNAGLFRELSSAESQLQAVLHNLVDAVTVQRRDGKLVYANQAAAEILGAESAERLIATPPGELVSRFESFTEDGEPLDVERLPGRRVMRGESPKPLLVRALDRETGEERWRLVKASPVARPDGDADLVVNVIEDVTDVKRAELYQRLLADTSRALSASLDSDATVQRIAETTVPRFADWCSVATVREDDLLEQVALAHIDPAKVEFGRRMNERYPSSVDDARIREVIRYRASLRLDVPDELLRDAARDEEHYGLLKELGLRSAIMVPIAGPDDVIGMITFVNAESGRVFDESDLAVGEELARRAGMALQNARLYEQRSVVAHTLQQALLPQELPEIPGWRISTLYDAASEGSEVGGDFYDAFRIPGGWMVVIGDVCGRGVDAAAVTALARYTLRTAGALSGDMVTAVAQLNERLLERGAEGICTVATIALRDSGRAEILSAGHPPPLLLRGAEVLPLEERGPMLGFVRRAHWPVQHVALEPGDQLVLYTDGVTELEGESERFGEQRLRATVSGATSPEAVLDRVRSAHGSFSDRPSEDDLAMVSVMRASVSELSVLRPAASSSGA